VSPDVAPIRSLSTTPPAARLQAPVPSRIPYAHRGSRRPALGLGWSELAELESGWQRLTFPKGAARSATDAVPAAELCSYLRCPPDLSGRAGRLTRDPSDPHACRRDPARVQRSGKTFGLFRGARARPQVRSDHAVPRTGSSHRLGTGDGSPRPARSSPQS
jgi:hypothetical protein